MSKDLSTVSPPPQGFVKEMLPAGAYGPYYEPREGYTFERAGHTFHIFLAGGYNAMGLIGTEHSGIVIFSVTDKQVVLDRHQPPAVEMSRFSIMGHELFNEKCAEIRDILRMSEKEFSDFIDVNPLTRYNPFPGSAKEPLKMVSARARLTKALLQEYGQLFKTHNEGDVKARFLSIGRVLGKQILKDLGCPADKAKVSINPGGVAVGGDVYVDTDGLVLKDGFGDPLGIHMNIGQSLDRQRIMYRSKNSTRGLQSEGMNQFYPVEALVKDYPQFIKDVKKRLRMDPASCEA